MKALKGIYAPILTPFQNHDQIHWSSLERHVRWLVDSGIHGIFALGSTSEAMFMPLTKKKQLAQGIHSLVPPEVPVIFQTGCNSLEETLVLSQYVLGLGAKTLSILTPSYYTLDDDSLATYYARISREFPKVPLCVYNFASRTNNDITPALLKRLASESPDIVGIKESTESVKRLQEHVEKNRDLSILAGTNSHIVTALRHGCSGAVATLSNVVPSLLVELYEAGVAGQWDKASECQSAIAEVRKLLKSLGPDLQVYKKATEVFGGFAFGGMYPPHRELTDDEHARIRELIQRFQENTVFAVR